MKHWHAMTRRRLFLISAAAMLCGCSQVAQQPIQPTVTAQPVVGNADSPSIAPTAIPLQPTAPPTMRPTSVPANPAPELSGDGVWLNSAPLTLAELHGKVVLVEFWTYGCINCQRTKPYVRAWWDTYQDDGLVIIGVHTPEFESEKSLENVQVAMQEQGVTWPVVQDNDKQIWRAYQNRYWPRFYLIDKQGNIIYNHIGEGAYEETERRIAEALAQES